MGTFEVAAQLCRAAQRIKCHQFPALVVNLMKESAAPALVQRLLTINCWKKKIIPVLLPGGPHETPRCSHMSKIHLKSTGTDTAKERQVASPAGGLLPAELVGFSFFSLWPRTSCAEEPGWPVCGVQLSPACSFITRRNTGDRAMLLQETGDLLAAKSVNNQWWNFIFITVNYAAWVVSEEGNTFI